MYDWMAVEASRQRRERLLQDAERSRAVHALRATRGRRASLLSPSCGNSHVTSVVRESSCTPSAQAISDTRSQP